MPVSFDGVVYYLTGLLRNVVKTNWHYVLEKQQLQC